MSQPEINKYPPKSKGIKRSLSVPVTTQTKKPAYRMSPNTRDAKIKEFERFVSESEVTSRFEIKTANKTVYFSYFIGRLNPPHRGHVTALIDLVLDAKNNGSMTLILFGSGPKQSDGERRTMDDPITFETKKAFVVSKLVEKGGREGKDFLIQEMTSPHADVANYVRNEIDKISGKISKIDIKHVAGGKDDDANKLKSVLVYVEDIARKKVTDAEVNAEVVVTGPPPSETGAVATYMSATNVRKDAYRSQLPGGKGYDDWPGEYKTFYGPKYAEQIFNEILYPLEKMHPADKEAVINNYIDPQPKPSKGKSTGTRTRKNKGGRKNSRKMRRKSH
jgi:hypothetical protein